MFITTMSRSERTTASSAANASRPQRDAREGAQNDVGEGTRAARQRERHRAGTERTDRHHLRVPFDWTVGSRLRARRSVERGESLVAEAGVQPRLHAFPGIAARPRLPEQQDSVRGVTEEADRALSESLEQRGSRRDAGLHGAMLLEEVPHPRQRVECRNGRGDLDGEAGQRVARATIPVAIAGDIRSELDHAPTQQVRIGGMVPGPADRVVGSDVVIGLDLLDRVDQVAERDALGVECDHDVRQDRVHFGPVDTVDGVQALLERAYQLSGSRSVDAARFNVRTPRGGPHVTRSRSGSNRGRELHRT